MREYSEATKARWALRNAVNHSEDRAALARFALRHHTKSKDIEVIPGTHIVALRRGQCTHVGFVEMGALLRAYGFECEEWESGKHLVELKGGEHCHLWSAFLKDFRDEEAAAANLKWHGQIAARKALAKA